MATQTTNYNLSKPDSTDPFSQFRQSYNDNMDIIDANLGGGGGSGGHTILDPSGSALPQEDDLQFTGAVSVSDDNVNGKTIVDIKGGNVYGAFIDPNRVITSVTFSGSLTYTATEDSFAVVGIVSDSSSEGKIYIDGVVYTSLYNTGGASVYQSASVYLRKGQVMTVSEGNGAWTVSYTVYGLIQGTNGIFAPVIYSDNERVIGVWRDNKPLYAKTFVKNSTDTSGAGVSFDVSALDIDTCVDIFGTCDRIVTGVGTLIYPFNAYEDASLRTYVAYSKFNTCINFNIRFYLGESTSTQYITILYTKNADVAGSGNWNTDGVPTVHYSTSEQVIGTWIDGKPLYERVLELTQDTTLTADTWVKTEFNQDTKKALIKVTVVVGLSGAVIEALSGGFIDGKIALNSARAVGLSVASNAMLIIQYTKTTD